MNKAFQIPVKEFDYELPENRIAKYPLNGRNLSKVLVYKNKEISEDIFSNISSYIASGSLLIFNDTRVVHARLEFYKKTGSRIEIFCLDPYLPADYSSSFVSRQSCQWKCLVGNLKKWRIEKLVLKSVIQSKEVTLTASLMQSDNTYHIIEFEWNHNFTFAEILETFGNIPIPPYLNRKSEKSDNTRYQTVYSKINGSVAAPTAGLHFTQNEFTNLKKKGVESGFLTLHVGAGTFLPVKTEFLGYHNMHTEHFIFSLEVIRKLIKHYPEIIAVGTTAVRTLESIFLIGEMLSKGIIQDYFHVNQWDAYDLKDKKSPLFALKFMEEFFIKNNIQEMKACTSLMIVPGYRFNLVKSIITNFHQPKSTLLALVSAFIGDNWKKVYEFALQNDFRFLSYGDSTLLMPGK